MKLKYIFASGVLFFLLAGADCGNIVPVCDDGPGDAVRVLAGSDAFIETSSEDNNTYLLTIANPDKYMHWRTGWDGDYGNQSLSCFTQYWDAHFKNSEVQAIVWIDSSEPACATVSDLTSTLGIVTATLKRPTKFYKSLAGTGDIVLELNRDCNPDLGCLGKLDLANCNQPFFTPDNDNFTSSATGASLNHASFDGVQMPHSDFSGAALSYASFSGANVQDTDFNNALLLFTDFTGANMDEVKLGNALVYFVTAPNGELVNSAQALLNNRGGAVSTTTSSITFTTITTTAASTTTTILPSTTTIM